ncbi:hypothetical protein JCM19037_2266 [Geomicrobium sp. JCM 19037]|uniref:hypothetical protein n=1 Tax=Geomicrobium sp. JCM 19037 TaxID=1460634 RepID=UPI00045F3D5D|nr:hypothetical protein [Geomicrobium sp. JCM 19037]GAK03905.1 hypothetical protein JCM19037_2266 [Geomicrobium sp. JCM 19037]
MQRQNDITWDEVVENHPQLEGAEPAWNYNESRQGFDVNRDFNADLDYVPEAADLPGNTANFGFFLSNESQILRDLYQELQAEFGGVEAYVDLHQMGANNVIEGTDEPVTIALDYPALGPDGNPRYADDYPEWDQDKSRKYALAAANGVNERADGGVEPGLARYVHHSTRDLPGQARHAFALTAPGRYCLKCLASSQVHRMIRTSSTSWKTGCGAFSIIWRTASINSMAMISMSYRSIGRTHRRCLNLHNLQLTLQRMQLASHLRIGRRSGKHGLTNLPYLTCPHAFNF